MAQSFKRKKFPPVLKTKKGPGPTDQNGLASNGAVQKLITERNKMSDQLWMLEWAMTAGKVSIMSWLQEMKGLTTHQCGEILTRCPAVNWRKTLEYVQNNTTNNLVKRHVESASQLNDQHMSAAKLGMAKAIEFMSKMTIEVKEKKNGQPYFSHFRTIDLKHCMETIRVAQQITRTALGLPNDEGSIHIWQQIQQNVNLHPPKQEDVPVVGEDLKTQVGRLQREYTYDGIREMMLLFKAKGLDADSGVLDIEPSPPSGT